MFFFVAWFSQAIAQTGCPSDFQAFANLIKNPGFEEGFSGFQSEYKHTHSHNWFSGSIYITPRPSEVHNNYRLCLDSTFRNLGKMLVVDGSEKRDLIVWQQTVSVEPNTDYFFSCFFATLLKANPAQLDIRINEQMIRKPFDYTYQHCRGSNFSFFWHSELATKATVTIRTYTTDLMGNDYALDNIQFYACKRIDKNNVERKLYSSSFIKLKFTGKDSLPVNTYKIQLGYRDSTLAERLQPDGKGLAYMWLKDKDAYLTVKAKGFFPLRDTLKALGKYNDSIQTKTFRLTPIDSGSKFILRDLTFDRSSHVLSDPSKRELGKILELLQDNPEISLEIHGHTDNQGDALKNYELSVDRVTSVKNYLIENGISANRLNGTGFGGTKPLVGFGSEEERRINRRVEFIVVKEK